MLLVTTQSQQKGEEAAQARRESEGETLQVNPDVCQRAWRPVCPETQGTPNKKRHFGCGLMMTSSKEVCRRGR